MNQKQMFSAILLYGWEKVKHYVLFDGLSKKEAQLIEAALIRDWKTTMRGSVGRATTQFSQRLKGWMGL